jgi:hypothetical protein
MEEMCLHMTQHKQFSLFTSCLVSNPLDPKIVIKSFWPGSNYFQDYPCIDLAVKGYTINDYKFPFTVDTSAAYSTIGLYFRVFLLDLQLNKTTEIGLIGGIKLECNKVCWNIRYATPKNNFRYISS